MSNVTVLSLFLRVLAGVSREVLTVLGRCSLPRLKNDLVNTTRSRISMLKLDRNEGT